MQMPNRMLAYVAPAVAREYRRNPSEIGDRALAAMLEAVHKRAMVDVAAELRAILETPAGPEGPAGSPDTSGL